MDHVPARCGAVRRPGDPHVAAPARRHRGELPADWIFALQSDPADWLAGADEGASEEFREWLGVQRQRMEAVRSDREAPAPAAAPALPAVPAAREAEGCAEVAAITLLRVQLADVEASDRHPSTPEMDALVEALKAEVRRFDGVVLATDDAGCTLGFGVDSRHTGQRWQALRCAAALAAMMPPAAP